MRIAVVSMDTRGGIVPYVALGQGLRRAGHEVRMVAPADFAPMLAEAGLPISPLSGSVEEVLRGSTGATERGTMASMRFAAREMKPRIHAWTRETLEAGEGVDVAPGAWEAWSSACRSPRGWESRSSRRRCSPWVRPQAPTRASWWRGPGGSTRRSGPGPTSWTRAEDGAARVPWQEAVLGPDGLLARASDDDDEPALRIGRIEPGRETSGPYEATTVRFTDQALAMPPVQG